MKIQLSKTRMVPDAMTVWYEHGPEVDMVADLKNLPFAPGSVEAIYSFHVLEHLMPSDCVPALASWMKCLAPGAKFFVVNDDFEYLCRAFVSGDVSIEQFNADFTHPTYITRDNIVKMLGAVGIMSDNIVLWFADVTGEFKKAEHELVVSVKL